MFNLDSVARDIRQVIRVTLNMPDGTVRPANQEGPAGDQVTQFATVLVLDITPTGLDEEKLKTDADDPLKLQWSLTGQRLIDTSVQFFRGDAYSKAARLVALLQSADATLLLGWLGLGLVQAGPIRNITAVIDGYWESRAQVDIKFHVIAQEQASIRTYGTFPITTESETQSTSFEVKEK